MKGELQLILSNSAHIVPNERESSNIPLDETNAANFPKFRISKSLSLKTFPNIPSSAL